MVHRFLERILSVAMASCLLLPHQGSADTGEVSAEKSLTIKPYLDARYRLETVDQEGLPRNATASTLRVKAGLETDEFHGFSALVEGEAIATIGAEKFNDTLNGRMQFPVVADPEDVVLNQAYLRYRKNGVVDAKAGRQTVNLDTQRWVGSVGWRQNDQTLDAAMVTVGSAKKLSATYAYAWRVNRIFGPDSPIGTFRNTDIHLVRASYAIPSVGTLSGYGYFLDIPTAAAASSKTFGVRLSGKQNLGSVKLLYAAEYAKQSDHGPNPANFKHDYLLLEPGVTVGPVTAKIGLERLEGNGVTALQTPLATLHKFNGWADKFLNTPASGLRDLYGDITIKPTGQKWLKGTTFKAVYHDFNSTVGSINYGQEWNLLVARNFGKHVSASLKFAHYDAQALATDTTKFWFTLQFKYK